MRLSTKRIYFEDYVFDVWDNVYEPAEDSFLFAENLNVQETETVLDVGTGCGILGILAAEKASRVVAVEVNPYAVRCARENAKLNKVQNRICYIQSDLLTPLRDSFKFDVILFNSPYLPVDENETASWIGRAWTGGASGRQLIDRFIVEVQSHFKQKGRVLLMQSTLADVNETLRRFADYGMHAKVEAECALPFFEKIKLIEARL